MIEQIVIAAEGTERDIAAVPVGVAIARQLGIPATLLSVVAGENIVETHRMALTSRFAALGTDGFTIEVRAHNDAASCIVEALRERDGALGCLSTHARSPVGELVLGSIAEQVVRETHMPLLLIGPEMSRTWSPGIRTILLCVDTSALSEALVPTAAELATRTGANLLLIEMLGTIRASAKGPSDVAGESSYLHQVADRLKHDYGLQPSWEVLHGDDPGSAIAEYAHGLPGVLIAMATHGRSGLAQVISGSVSHRTLQLADCPVLVARPVAGESSEGS